LRFRLFVTNTVGERANTADDHFSAITRFHEMAGLRVKTHASMVPLAIKSPGLSGMPHR